MINTIRIIPIINIQNAFLFTSNIHCNTLKSYILQTAEISIIICKYHKHHLNRKVHKDSIINESLTCRNLECLGHYLILHKFRIFRIKCIFISSLVTMIPQYATIKEYTTKCSICRICNRTCHCLDLTISNVEICIIIGRNNLSIHLC